MSVETYDEFKKRKDPPRWWTPKIDRAVLQDLMRRNDLQAILHYGGLVPACGGAGVRRRRPVQHREPLVHPGVLRLWEFSTA